MQAFRVTTISHQSTRSTRFRGHGHSRILSNNDRGSYVNPMNDLNEATSVPSIWQPGFQSPFNQRTPHRHIPEEDNSFVQYFPTQTTFTNQYFQTNFLTSQNFICPF